jgi:hypothetical protein
MISSLTEHGRIGVTAVGESPQEAMRILREGQGRCCLLRAASPARKVGCLGRKVS